MAKWVDKFGKYRQLVDDGEIHSVSMRGLKKLMPRTFGDLEPWAVAIRKKKGAKIMNKAIGLDHLINPGVSTPGREAIGDVKNIAKDLFDLAKYDL